MKQDIFEYLDEDKQAQEKLDKELAKEKLIRVSSFAKEHGISVQWAYKLAERGDIKMVIIDGMKFIKSSTALNLKNLR